MARKPVVRQGRFARQAALESLLRFGPETSALTELMRQAETNYQTGVQQAQGTAANIVQAVKQTRPEVRQVYQNAGLAQARAAHTTQADIASLGPVADSIKAAASIENSMASSRIAESKAQALGGLATQRVAAQQGAQFAAQNARSSFVTDVAKILQRKQGLAGEQGAFSALTTRELRNAHQQQQFQLRQQRITQRGQTRRELIAQRGQNQREAAGNRQSNINSLRSAGLDPATGTPIPNGPLDPSKPLKFSPAEDRQRRQDRIKEHKENTAARTKIVEASELWDRLANTKIQPVDANDNPIGPKRLPTHVETEDRLMEKYGYEKRQIDIARDILRNGGRLSDRGVAAMREIGVRIPREWFPRKPRPSRAPIRKQPRNTPSYGGT